MYKGKDTISPVWAGLISPVLRCQCSVVSKPFVVLTLQAPVQESEALFHDTEQEDTVAIYEHHRQKIWGGGGSREFRDF